ncbi:MAG: DNA topoisomerase IB [Pseudomonadota bacterium]
MQLISALQNMPDAVRSVEPPDDLTFVDGDTPGIIRIRANRRKAEFIYRYAVSGLEVTEDDQARIKGLGIPPAWRDVWICPEPNGYLQATGIDEAGRKQYRYHPAWRAFRERTKFSALTEFGALLPRIRRRVRQVFRENSEADCELVTAALVRLLDDAPLRIGSQTHAQDALGASTLKKRNVRISKGVLHLDYTAKGGKRVRRQIKDRRLLSVLQSIDDLPGKTLFRYIGADGDVHQLRSEHVNSWLQDVTCSAHITAKTFRTWAGSLAAFERAVNDKNLTIKAMSEAASQKLRNTPAVARSSYIHPSIVDMKNKGFEERQKLFATVTQSASDLTRLETAMLMFLARAEGIEVI